MVRKLLDDCFLTDQERMRHDDALELLRARVLPLAATQLTPLAAAHGHILAQSVTAPRPVPACDNAAVDGYAFAHADYIALQGRLPVSQRIAAGPAGMQALQAGTAARIFTGATMPTGADTVAMQEDAEIEKQNGTPVVSIPPGLKAGANRRRAGEDLAQGEVLLQPGLRLRPQDIAAIASTGLAEITCHAPLRIALVSTGDEIVRPGAPLERGQVYDSNHFLLRALLAGSNVAIDDLGILPDQADIVQKTLQQAALTHDVILTTGGASRGEEDHVIDAIGNLGQRHMWQLAIKPGRPMSFGQIGDCVFLGLPGNPVAAMVCFLMYVWPVLHRLGGGTWVTPTRFPLPAAFDMVKKPGRREFLRGFLLNENGCVSVGKYARDGSGLISSLRAADGLIELPETIEEVKSGDMIAFIPFSHFGIV